MWSQVGLRKHHYEQSWWRWWNSSWALSNPERWCCESAALNMPADLENSAVARGLEKVSFHSNPKERQCQRMLKLPQIALISHASKVMLKLFQARTVNFQMFKLVLQKAENQRSNCQHPLDHQKSNRIPGKHLFLLYWLCQSLWLCGSQETVENSERDGNTWPPDLPLEKSVCRLESNS